VYQNNLVIYVLFQVRDQLKQAGVSPLEEYIPPRYVKGKSNCTSTDLL
jgi:hypothetical protein